MAFTDDDLKRLKERQHGPSISLSASQMKAILARLEAAEEFIEQNHAPEAWDDVLSYIAWRKAAGKAE